MEEIYVCSPLALRVAASTARCSITGETEHVSLATCDDHMM
jgi:hypothetical protein